MKATVRKIKDNEWIAEVEGKGKKPFQNIEDYPIVSPSDIEYLEKNNMDGKEVEGDTIISNIYGEKIEPLFELSTPPIHPNPHTENLQYGLAFADKVKELSDPGEENLLDEYWNWKHCDNNEDIISDKKYLSLTKDQQKYYRRWATNKAVGEHIQEINTPIHSDPAGEEGNNLIANLTAILGAVETVGWGGGDQGMALQRISKYAHEAMRSAKGVKPPTPHSDPAGEENLDRDFIAELVLKWYDPALYPNLTPVEYNCQRKKDHSRVDSRIQD